MCNCTNLSHFANHVLSSSVHPNQKQPANLTSKGMISIGCAEFLMRYLLVRVDTQSFVLENSQTEAIEPDLQAAYQAAEAAIIAFEAIDEPTPEQSRTLKARLSVFGWPFGASA